MGAGGTAPGTEIEATALAAQATWLHRSPAEMRWATRLSMEDDCGATDPAREQRCGRIRVIGIRALVAYLPSPEPGPAGSPQSTSRQVRPKPPSGPRFRRTRPFGNMRHCRRLSAERGRLGSSARCKEHPHELPKRRRPATKTRRPPVTSRQIGDCARVTPRRHRRRTGTAGERCWARISGSSLSPLC